MIEMPLIPHHFKTSCLKPSVLWWVLSTLLLAALTPGVGAQETLTLPQTDTLTTRFTYQATVPAVPVGAKQLDVWLPIPSDSPLQSVRDLTVESPISYKITREKKFGNRMIYVHVPATQTAFSIVVSFVVERHKPLNDLENKDPEKKDLKKSNVEKPTDAHQTGSDFSQWQQPLLLKSDKKVPVGGRYRTLAQDVIQGQSAPAAQMRALFEHVVATMQYDYKKESPHLGEGDVAFVCDYKKGNCSDLHSYLISLDRSLAIPAVLEYGFPISGVPVADPLPVEGIISGYHCWMWFHDPAVTTNAGWVAVDAADARRWLDAGRPDKKDYLFGHLIPERSAVTMSRGRDLTLLPAQKARPLNYFIYPYAEADGKSVEAKWELRYHRL